MANVVIDDSSLHAIGDALRGKLGDTHIEKRYVETIHHPETSKDMKPKIAKTPNAVDFTTRNGGYGNNRDNTQTVKVEGATSLLIDVAYQTESTSYDYLLINHGTTKYGGTTLTRKSIVVNGDTVTFTFKSDNSNDSYLGYYAEVLGVDANGHVLQDVIPAWDEDIYEDVVVNNVFKPREMADAIKSIKKGQMKYAYLTSPDNLSFDVSPYISEGDNFILYYSQRMSGSSSGSYWYNSIFTTFFTEEQRQYPHQTSAATYNRVGTTVWSDMDTLDEITAVAKRPTTVNNYSQISVTYENGIVANSHGVAPNAILVYAD